MVKRGLNLEENLFPEEEPPTRWLKSKKEGTRKVYLGAFRAYEEFLGMDAKELVAEINA
jgi:hypothetical protein